MDTDRAVELSVLVRYRNMISGMCHEIETVSTAPIAQHITAATDIIGTIDYDVDDALDLERVVSVSFAPIDAMCFAHPLFGSDDENIGIVYIDGLGDNIELIDGAGVLGYAKIAMLEETRCVTFAFGGGNTNLPGINDGSGMGSSYVTRWVDYKQGLVGISA